MEELMDDKKGILTPEERERFKLAMSNTDILKRKTAQPLSQQESLDRWFDVNG
jgi:hypothetical protein